MVRPFSQHKQPSHIRAESLSFCLFCFNKFFANPCSELLRENKRQLDKAIRDLDRERMGLQNQEKKVVLEIKKMAKEGQTVRTLRALAGIFSAFVYSVRLVS